MQSQRKHAPAAEQVERIPGPRVGWVVSGGRGQPLKVDYPGNPLGPLVARATIQYDEGVLARAARERVEAILLFEEGEPARPLLVGLLPSQTPLVDEILTQPLPRKPVVARLDGERVLLEGSEEVVLQCGKASLTLRRDGKVVLRGVNLITEASEVHRIRGGKVRIN